MSGAAIARARPRRAAVELSAFGLRWAAIGVMLVAWEALVRAFASDSKFIAPPTEIVAALPELLSDERVLTGLRTTGLEFVLAFALAAVAGILLGASLGLSRLFGPSRNLLHVLFTLPQVAIYPLFVLWLGTGFDSKLAFGFTHAIFPITLTTMAAARSVDPTLLASIRSMGGGRVAALRKVVLPSILPNVAAGLRVGASLALLGVLLAELMVSEGGIGGMISLLSSSFDPARLDALITLICVVAVAINALIRRGELRLSRWRTT